MSFPVQPPARYPEELRKGRDSLLLDLFYIILFCSGWEAGSKNVLVAGGSTLQRRRLFFYKLLGMYIDSNMKDKVKKAEKEDVILALRFSPMLSFVAFGWLFTILFLLSPPKNTVNLKLCGKNLA